jgi:hypothetical protein
MVKSSSFVSGWVDYRNTLTAILRLALAGLFNCCKQSLKWHFPVTATPTITPIPTATYNQKVHDISQFFLSIL